MALISRKNAVVSLGMSCQTAHQIRHHEKLIACALGDDGLVWQSGFFNNLISPLASVASLFQEPLPSQIPLTELELAFRPRWAKHGMFFWHDPYRPEILQSKYTHLMSKLAQLSDIENVVFVISNTQHNLRDLSQVAPGLDPAFDQRTAGLLTDRVNKLLGRTCRFLFVSDPRLGQLPHVFGDSRSYAIEQNGHSWQGNHVAWSQVFRSFFGYYGALTDPRIATQADILRRRCALLEGHYETIRAASVQTREQLTRMREQNVDLRGKLLALQSSRAGSVSREVNDAGAPRTAVRQRSAWFSRVRGRLISAGLWPV